MTTQTTTKAGHETQKANVGQQNVKKYPKAIKEKGIKWELAPPTIIAEI